MSNTVKWFTSNMTGAPVLSGQAGALVALLDACLVNGFNAVAVSGITRTDSTATATSVGHGYSPGQVVLVAGANQPEYNGEQRVLTTTANSFTYTVSGTPDTPATGTLTAKAAPAGWTKAFSDTNKAAYQSSEPSATGCLLRVDDSAAQSAILRGYEAMTDIDTGTGPFPTAAQLDGGILPRKSDASSSAARPWLLLTDGHLFHLFNAWTSTSVLTGQHEWHAFGDPITYKAGDNYHTLLGGNYALPNTIGVMNAMMGCPASAQNGQYMARSYTQLASAIAFLKAGPNMSGIGIISNTGTYPNPADNALHVRYPVDLWEGVNTILRGALPGIYYPLQNIAPVLSTGDWITPVAGLPGKTLLAVDLISIYGSGMVLLDLTGPWR